MDQGYTVKGSCQTKSFPVVGDIIICKYTKATQVLSLEAKSSGVKLITFDGDATTTHEFKELNDPVMCGKSSGTWTVDASGFGVFDG